MNLKGVAGFRDRLNAAARSTRPMASAWGDAYVQVARPQIPVRTGRTRQSVQRSQVTDHGAEIVGSQVAVMIDTGTGSHAITAFGGGVLKFQMNSGAVFAPKAQHPGMRARPYRKRAADEALRRAPLQDALVDAWNRAD
jgi:hypothetical protein